MSNNALPEFVQALLKPTLYPHPVDQVDLVQTHISYVFLAGDYVYKFKKPMNFGFLDFSDLEKRRINCQRELELNKRLCPDIYLELVTIGQDDGVYALNSCAEPIEYGVKMVRMPEERMMRNLIDDGKLGSAQLRQLVQTLIPFYQAADGGEEIRSFGTAKAVAVNVLENFEQTASFIDQGALTQAQFDTISNYARKMLADEALFQKRVDGGFIRDCHGDLYSANICLADKPYIYDCIEFNERFRYCDIASDVAFLAMDLDFHGLTELSADFIEEFCASSQDSGLMTMLDFYKCYRAYVRGKIGLFTAADPNVDQELQAKCVAESARYFELACQYASNG